MIRPHSQSKTVGALLSLLYRKKERPPPVADVSMWRRPFLLMGSPKGNQIMLLLVVLKTLVEELDVARDVLLIDEATRERLTLVIDRHVERLCEVAKFRLLQVRPLVTNGAQRAGRTIRVLHLHRLVERRLVIDEEGDEDIFFFFLISINSTISAINHCRPCV